MVDLWVCELPTWLVLLLLVVVLHVYYMSSTHSTFRKLGIAGPKPLPVIGNSLFTFKHGLINTVIMGYKHYKKNKVYGKFEGRTPILTVCDLDMLREIMIKRANSFVNRRQYAAINQPLLENIMFNIRDDFWKQHRTILRPSLSTGRLKALYPRLEKKLRSMLDIMRDKVGPEGGMFEISDIIGRFCMDVVADIGFDVDCDSLHNPQSDFVKHARVILGTFGERAFGFELFAPPFLKNILDFFGILILPKKEIMLLRDFTTKALATRKATPKEDLPDDIMQFMIDHSEIGSVATTGRMRKLSLEEIHGSTLTYLLAGYDTSAKGFYYSMYQLAMNPSCLQRAQKEVDDVLRGEFPNPDNVTDLNYLDQSIKEGNRLIPLGPYVERKCNQEEDLFGLRIPKDMNIRIPIVGIHRDPELYPNPDKYDPERFHPSAVEKRHPMAFLPFGAGPRACFGQALATLMMKTGMAAMMQEFEITPCSQSVYPVRLLPLGDVIADHGLWVRLTPRRKL